MPAPVMVPYERARTDSPDSPSEAVRGQEEFRNVAPLSGLEGRDRALAGSFGPDCVSRFTLLLCQVVVESRRGSGSTHGLALPRRKSPRVPQGARMVKKLG